MDKEDFDSMGFEVEILPSGNINLLNSIPFCLNGINTICCYRGGRYIRTTTYKSLDSLLNDISELKLLEISDIRTFTKPKAKSTITNKNQPGVSCTTTDRDLGEYLTSVPSKPTKTKRGRKPKS